MTASYEAVRTDVVLEDGPTRRKPGAVVIVDGLYNNATTVAQVEQAGGTLCFSGLKAERVSDAFDYDRVTDQIVCPQGHRSIGKVRVDQGDLYSFSVKDCGVCPLRAECLTPGEREGKAMPRRRVYLSDVRKRKRLAGAGGSRLVEGAAAAPRAHRGQVRRADEPPRAASGPLLGAHEGDHAGAPQRHHGQPEASGQAAGGPTGPG